MHYLFPSRWRLRTSRYGNPDSHNHRDPNSDENANPRRHHRADQHTHRNRINSDDPCDCNVHPGYATDGNADAYCHGDTYSDAYCNIGGAATVVATMERWSRHL
jgi:hypothetical protein